MNPHSALGDTANLFSHPCLPKQELHPSRPETPCAVIGSGYRSVSEDRQQAQEREREVRFKPHLRSSSLLPR